jgi:apolipoprotein N-acyltransferase
VLICYEAIFPGLARWSVRQGATVLVNLTNDAWFGPTVAPVQHLTMAVFRAVECRRPLIRVANTGYSALVDIDGRVRDRTELFTTTYRVGAIAWSDTTSLYVAWGDWFAYLCVAGTMVIGIAVATPPPCVAGPRRGICGLWS